MAIVREFEFKTGKGGKAITIGQITDAHINTVNSYDMQDAEIADSFAHRKWGAGGMICTPKVRHFWRCIFLWVKEKTKFIVQNLKSVL